MDLLSTDMNSMLNSMSGWWGSGQPPKDSTTNEPDNGQNKDSPPNEEASTKTETTESPEGEVPSTNEKPQKEMPDLEVLEEMSNKAVKSAKEWGSYLFEFGKTATNQVTDQVSKTAKQFKETIDEKTMIGDFNKIQSEFVGENQERKKKSEAAVAPWVGYNEEEAMKSQILALSADKRNFMRNPPAGVQFNFDFETSYPVATAMLQEDPNLEKMRFELVPKQVKEHRFWRNYFYRVSLIKQSAQLTSLAQNTGSTSESPSRQTSESSKGAKQKRKSSSKEDEKEAEEFHPSSPTEHEFISDAFQESQISEDDLKKEMQQLGMSDKEDDIPEWEKELQAELQEYEVVTDGNDLADDDDLEQEILDQLEAESNGESAPES